MSWMPAVQSDQRGGQHVAKMCPECVMSRPPGIGVTVTSERSQHANKTEALRLLRMIVTAKLEAESRGVR